MADDAPKDKLVQQLSLSARPKTLDGLIGQEKIARAIRGHISTGRYPKAWLFHGPKGTGKTTAARIVALSYQCDHQKLFGRPCKECRALAPDGMSNGTWGNFPIVEISGGSVSRKEDMEARLGGVRAGLMGIGNYRIFLINEVQQCSPSTIAMFLDLCEDTPSTTVFIFTTTEAARLSEAFRSRCQCYEFKELDTDMVEVMVGKLLQRIGSELPADRLAEALMDAKVFSQRLVAQAVERYSGGADPEEAASVTGVPEMDIMGLSKAITHGDWSSAARYLANAQASDARGLRFMIMKYLRGQLLESSEVGPRADAIAKAITALATVENAEDAVIFASICAQAYTLVKIFQHYTV